MATSKSRAQDRLLAITSRAGTSRPTRAKAQKPDGARNVYEEMLSEAASSARDADRPFKRRKVAGQQQDPTTLPKPLPRARQIAPKQSTTARASTALHNTTDDEVPLAQQQTIEDSEEEDESDFGFEDVDLDQAATNPSLAKQLDDDIADVSVEIGSGKAPKKSVTRRKPATAGEKLVKLTTHKAHVLFLLFCCHVRNVWCNSPAVESKLKKALPARTISMLHPDANMIQFGRSESFLNGLKLAVDLWHVKFKVTASGMHRARWVEDQAGIEQQIRAIQDEQISVDKREFVKAAASLQGSQDVGNQLFCALMRAVGVEARLVCSLQPLPFATTAKPLPPQETNTTLYAGTSSADDASAKSSASDTPSGKKLNILASGRRRRLLKPEFGAAIGGTVKPAPAPPKKPKIHRLDYPIFWVEVFNEAYQKWVPVDATVTGTVAKPAKLEPPISYDANTMTYVIAFEGDGVARDVTRRYARSYNAKTRKLRIESTEGGQQWYKDAMKVFRRRRRIDRDQVEDAELAKKEASEGLPNNVQDFKDHPYYALERHLKRHEVIWPKREVGKVNAGKSSKRNMESVYRRSDVQMVRSADKWYRFGREIKPGEQPLKHVPARSRKGADEMDTDTEEAHTTALYAFSQTMLYVPPPVVRGKIPKNIYGNLDVYVPSMVPPGGAHIQHPLAQKAARLLGIDYADAVTGFKFQGRHGTAITSGVVVAQELKEAVEAVIDGFQYAQENEEVRARTLESLRLWKRFLTGLRIAKRIGLLSDSGNRGGHYHKTEVVRKEMDRAEDEDEATVEAGGFFPEGADAAMPTAGHFKESVEEDEHEEGSPEPPEPQELQMEEERVEEAAPRLRRRRPQLESDDGDEEKSEEEYAPPSKRRQTRRRRLVDAESDSEEDEEPVATRTAATTRRRREFARDAKRSTYPEKADQDDYQQAGGFPPENGDGNVDDDGHAGGFLPDDAQDDASDINGGFSMEDVGEDINEYGGDFLPDGEEEAQQSHPATHLEPRPDNVAENGGGLLQEDDNTQQTAPVIRREPDEVAENGGGFLADDEAAPEEHGSLQRSNDSRKGEEAIKDFADDEAAVAEKTKQDTECEMDDLDMEEAQLSEDSRGSLLSHDSEDDDAEPDWL